MTCVMFEAARHWLVYFRQRLPGVVLQGECSGSLEANDASTKASLSKLAAFAPCQPPVVLDSSEEHLQIRANPYQRATDVAYVSLNYS